MAMDRFEEEALPHLSDIGALALHLTGDRDEAADLVQDTYYQALRYWDSYEQGTDCRAWLARVCRNHFFRSWRRRKQRYEGTVGAGRGRTRESLHPGRIADPSELTWTRIFEERLRNALGELPETYREPIRLRLFGELSYREIADLLGLPEGTVKSRLHRGRRRLAEELELHPSDREALTR